MSTVRQNEKHQIRVPSKLVDSDYGTKNVKNKKSKQLDEIVKIEWRWKIRRIMLMLIRIECVKVEFGAQKLYLIPIEFRDDGSEVVVFDEEIMEEGSKKWSLTMCGYFVGYKMSYQELAYNLFRMWGKFGLKHIIPNGNDVFLFKFKSEWDPSVCLDRTEPTKLPLWVKFRNLQLEAWSNKGISAIASRIGTPLIMDSITTNMCKMGTGRVGFSRVLIKVEATEEIDEMNKAEEKKKEEEKKALENEDFIQVRNRRKPSTYVNQPVKNAENNQGKKKNNVVYRQVVRRKVNEENDMGSGNKESVFSGDEVNRGSPENEPDGTDFVKDVNEVIEEQNDVYEVFTGSASKIAKNNLKASYANVLNVSGVETMGKMRRKLWVDLSAYKSISNNCPWVILGDLNVCLNIDDHSEGMSHSTQDMEYFQDCVNNLKIEDIGS
ncbi:RNA-directed DNA polymerase, eukaryota, reverse transcriptase zinc-binding domain protein, partial [Tanacetum coccineum]